MIKDTTKASSSKKDIKLQRPNNVSAPELREAGTSCGLLNLGNSTRIQSLPLTNRNVACFLNCLLQTYLCIPQLVELIFQSRQWKPASIPYKVPNRQLDYVLSSFTNQESNADTLAFLANLRETFLFLLLGNQNYIDPSNLVLSFFRAQSTPLLSPKAYYVPDSIVYGPESDVGEAHLELLGLLERCFSLLRTTPFHVLYIPFVDQSNESVDLLTGTPERIKKETLNPINKLFFGELVETITLDASEFKVKCPC
jgi:hypothetical protein